MTPDTKTFFDTLGNCPLFSVPLHFENEKGYCLKGKIVLAAQGGPLVLSPQNPPVAPQQTGKTPPPPPPPKNKWGYCSNSLQFNSNKENTTGLFAIAFAYHLAFGYDVRSMSFDQSKLPSTLRRNNFPDSQGRREAGLGVTCTT